MQIVNSASSAQCFNLDPGSIQLFINYSDYKTVSHCIQYARTVYTTRPVLTLINDGGLIIVSWRNSSTVSE